MAKDAEELKIILEMAENGGIMKAENKMLLQQIRELKAENKQLKSENNQLKEEKADLKEKLSAKTKECEELQGKLMYDTVYEQQDTNRQGSVVTVNNVYYVLSWPKTVGGCARF